MTNTMRIVVEIPNTCKTPTTPFASVGNEAVYKVGTHLVKDRLQFGVLRGQKHGRKSAT